MVDLDALEADAAREAAARAEEERLRAEAETAARRAEEERAASARTSSPAPRTYQGDPAANRALGERMAAARGWTGSEWAALDELWGVRESGWRTDAGNPEGAWGIPQAVPGSKMAAAGADWLTNPATQIAWGLDYVAGRYGSPSAALAHSYATGWY